MSTRPTDAAVTGAGAARVVLAALWDTAGRGGGGLGLVRGRAADVVALARGRGELAGVVGAGGGTTAEVAGVVAIAAALCWAAGCAPHPALPTASSSASTRHPILITGTSLPPTSRPAI